MGADNASEPPRTAASSLPHRSPHRAPYRSVPPWRTRDHARPPVDAVVMCLPRPLAGLGTSRHLAQIAAGLEALPESGPQRVYVGPPQDAEGPGAHRLREPFVPVGPADSTPAAYRVVTRALEQAFERLVHRGCRRVCVLSMGYTALGPEGVARARDRLRERTGDPAPHALVCVVDSAWPDTDEPDHRLDGNGWPLGRFYTPAYESRPGVSVAFFLTSAYGFDPVCLGERMPRGLCGVSVITPPYHESYHRFLRQTAEYARQEGLAVLHPDLPPLRLFREGDRLVPLVSSDIWDPQDTRDWMTPDEYETVTRGTRVLLEALVTEARRRRCRIFVPIDRAGDDFARNARIEGVATGGRVPDGAPVITVPYRGLSQAAHTRLLALSDLALSRTGGQANATAVLSLVRTPNLVMDLPARGYMQSEITSRCMVDGPVPDPADAPTSVRFEPLAEPLGWRVHWSWSPQRVAETLREALDGDVERRRRARAAEQAFLSLHRDPHGNLLRIVADLSGCGPSGSVPSGSGLQGEEADPSRS